MGFSMAVDGSPGSCRSSAREVRKLSRQVTQAGSELAHARSTASGAWTGEAAEQFASKARRMIKHADTLATGLSAFGGALDSVADAIERSRAEMDRARSIAARAEIPTPGDVFPAFGEIALEPGQEGPRDHGEGVITRAREAERSALEAFSRAATEASELFWGERLPEVKGAIGKLQGPAEMMTDRSTINEMIEPFYLPDPTDLPSPLSAFASLVPGAVRNSMLLADEIKKNARQPSSGRPGGFLLAPAKAAYAQWLEDAPDEDIDLTDRLLRAGFVGSMTAAGGVGGAYACLQFAATAAFTPVCADLGGRTGSVLSNWVLEMRDAEP